MTVNFKKLNMTSMGQCKMIGATAHLFCFFMLLANHQAGAFQPFFSDLEKLFNTSGISIIIGDNLDMELDVHNINFRDPTSFMSCTSFEEISMVVDHLLLQKYMGDLDFVLFLGSDHSELLMRLVNVEKLFNSGVVGILPEDSYTGENFLLQLNTRLYFYTWLEDYIIVKEKYAIRGVQVENTVGHWNEAEGFVIEELNIWERRTNLLGSVMRVVSVNLPPLHELYFEDDDETNIAGGGGLFIEPLNNLANMLNFTISFKKSIDGNFGAIDSNGTILVC